MSFYKISSENLIILHDDLDILIGKYLIQFAKGPHSHNGILSIESQIGKAFNRVRIGIEDRGNESLIKGEDYVLGKFNNEELKILTENVFNNIWLDLLKKV